MPRRPFYQPRHAPTAASRQRQTEHTYVLAWRLIHAVRHHPNSHPSSAAAAVQLAVELHITGSPTEQQVAA